ncbi:GroES-like protein [Meredithblackwellia eburnea MCA 4105]
MGSLSNTQAVPLVCKAAVVVNKGPKYELQLRTDYPVPVPAAGELLLRLNCCGLCMSDHHFMLGDWDFEMPCDCAGHEGAGFVAALGPEVNAEEWKVGDRAGIKPMYDTCHACEYCRNGMETYCDKVITTGAMKNGTYCEYVISPARYTTRIPNNVADEVAAPTMCSGATIYAALKASKARAGQWVVVPGAGGGVGHQALGYGRALGLRLIAVDTGVEKEEMCLELGAEAFIDFKKCADVEAEVKRLTGGGAHAVIVTGGTAAAYKSATMLLRKGGVQVCVGLPPVGAAIAGADPLHIIMNKITILGSLVGSKSDVDESLDFIARGLVKPRITVLPFEKFSEGLKMLVEGRAAGRVVIDYNL